MALAQALVRCPSVTPAEAGALGVLEEALRPLGFATHRLRFGDGAEAVENLVAVRGQGRPSFAFAGHSDVVPPGDAGRWSADPFGGEVTGGRLVGRGAADMKGALAAMVAAAERWAGSGAAGTLMLLVTGDEEGEAIHGTAPMLEWLAARGWVPEAALVGEPTSKVALGDTIKVGRRGSMNGWLRVHGVQGHVAYPGHADNAITRLTNVLTRLKTEPLDAGTAFFEPSNLEVTRVEGGDPTASNIIPGAASARFNIRFNDLHSEASLRAWVEGIVQEAAPGAELVLRCSGEAFHTDPGRLSDTVSAAVESVTGLRPLPSTGGGTSDARFIHRYCPVVELGLVGASMHKVDEMVPVRDIETLADVYAEVLRRWFAGA